jgi:hypothetical protein
MDNIELTKDEYEFISGLPKFDMEMLLSDIHEHGWPIARKTLSLMKEAATRNPSGFYADHAAS